MLLTNPKLETYPQVDQQVNVVITHWEKQGNKLCMLCDPSFIRKIYSQKKSERKKFKILFFITFLY